jgi:hypothetical protein
MDTPNTQIHDSSLNCLYIGTSIKSDGVKQCWWAQNGISKFLHFIKMENLLFS